ncbi:germination protein YpeB [Salinibacillus xinjiangensis]|uniref:Germination protein YpeB n=1 Tax=Salinibacillus xinjiangensis TaxID=1229268 RepID=A0A6G1X5Z4_9BACI|nr:germination protein YpeB [Salinibacillus xinjiangensis]MRG86423.1 germination protein YpeB [Salinibacillus xinjiangensis]
MIRWILIAVLAIGVAGVGFWGYQEHQEKNAVLIQAENNYQRSFHDLTYYVDLLHDKLGTVLAMNSPRSLSPELAEIWRITSDAHSEVGQLPLTLIPFNKTEEFLSNIGDFSYRTAVRGLDDDPLTVEETKMLEELYAQAGEIERELRKVQHLALENNLRWMDVQLALVNNDQKADNTIIDGFKTVEKNVESFSEGNFSQQLSGVSKDNEKEIKLEGENISENEVKSLAKDLFKVNDGNLKITTSGEGSDIKVFSASFEQDDKHGYMDITQKGGYLISMIVNRDVGEKSIGLYDGMNKAKKFLEKLGYDNMEAHNSAEYNNVGVYSFAYQQDDIRIYPDTVQVKVALDNGDVIGLSARDFLVHHQERDISEPKITVEEAKEEVNPNVKIQEESLAVIENDLGEEVLVYEFLGTLGDDTYRIYINANDGFEEQVEKLKQAEENFETSA